jgi:hypothetical protein
LSPIESQLIELEENLRRKNLPWRDTVNALARLHSLYASLEENWDATQTATRLSIDTTWLSKALRVHSELDSPKLEAATGIEGAYNILLKIDNRKAANVLSDLLESTDDIFRDLGKPSESAHSSTQTRLPRLNQRSQLSNLGASLRRSHF